MEQDNDNVDKEPLSLIDIDLPLDIVPGWDEIVSEASGLEIVRLIVRRALNHHEGYLWFDAAMLVSPSGKVVLIAGASHAGKSTAAAALAFGLNWKVLAEDVALIEPRNKVITPFASPISLREGSLERIARATGVTPGPVIGFEWVPLKGHLHYEQVPFNIDLAIELAVTNPLTDQPIAVASVSNSSFIHFLLPLCNALHLPNGIELLDESLQKARCYRLDGGSLGDRLNFIASQLNESTVNITPAPK